MRDDSSGDRRVCFDELNRVEMTAWRQLARNTERAVADVGSQFEYTLGLKPSDDSVEKRPFLVADIDQELLLVRVVVDGLDRGSEVPSGGIRQNVIGDAFLASV